MSDHATPKAKSNFAVKTVENLIFNVRWILPLFYLGLVGVMVMYGFTYLQELITLFHEFTHLSTDQMKLAALDTVDIVMIANLIKMIITGSYNSFISKSHGYVNENISSGMLKIKISTSVIVVCSIHLLKAFVQPPVWDVLTKELVIYGAFIVSALALGVLEYLHVKSEVLEHEASRNTSAD